jgi:hypothetical protein
MLGFNHKCVDQDLEWLYMCLLVSRRVLDQRVSRRKFGSRSAIFIFVCIYPFYAS